MEIYSINYPNGFCGSWLQWLLTEHKEFANKRDPDHHTYFHYQSFVDNNKSTVRVAGTPSVWMPPVKLNDWMIKDLELFNHLPVPPMLSLEDYISNERYNITAPKLAIKVGVNHAPSALAPFLSQFIKLGLKFIILTVNDQTHLNYIENRIKAYAPVMNINNDINYRLNSIKQLSAKLVKIPNNVYKIVDIGKLVFNKDINEYKTLCEFTGIELNTTIFNNMTDEFINNVWLPHIT